MTITKLSPYSEISYIDTAPQKRFYFLVKNYEPGNEHQLEEIKEFARKNVEPDFERYAVYAMDFYKESNKTNTDYRQTPSDLLDWHATDLIFTLYWNYGKFAIFHIYKDGKSIKSSE